MGPFGTTKLEVPRTDIFPAKGARQNIMTPVQKGRKEERKEGRRGPLQREKSCVRCGESKQLLMLQKLGLIGLNNLTFKGARS